MAVGILFYCIVIKSSVIKTNQPSVKEIINLEQYTSRGAVTKTL